MYQKRDLIYTHGKWKKNISDAPRHNFLVKLPQGTLLSEGAPPAYFEIHIWHNIAATETIIVHRELSDLSKLSVLIEYYVSTGLGK